jgi:hypothetical protein
MIQGRREVHSVVIDTLCLRLNIPVKVAVDGVVNRFYLKAMSSTQDRETETRGWRELCSYSRLTDSPRGKVEPA